MLTKMFRNTLVASSLLVGASLMVGQIAQAGTDSGDVTGEITTNNLVTYTAPAAAASLDPVAGNTDMDFGSVNVRDNSNAGWILTVQSANNSTLVGDTNSEVITYTGLSFNNATLGAANDIDVSGGTAVNVYTPNTLTCATQAGCDVTITADIANTEVNGKSVDTYRDTLTFVLTSN
jgi:hypothetical protein